MKAVVHDFQLPTCQLTQLPTLLDPAYCSRTCTRCGTLATIPRIEGVSSRSITWYSRVKPSPLMTSLCFTGVQIFERTYCSRIFFFAAVISLQLLQRLAAQGSHVLAVAKFIERVKGRLDHVVRIGGADRLGEHVLHAH